MYIEDSLNIKKLSRFELKNKLREKGVNTQDIYDAFQKFEDELRSKEIEEKVKQMARENTSYGMMEDDEDDTDVDTNTAEE